MVKCQQSLIGVKECWCSQWLTRSWVNWRAPTLPPEQRQREGRDETGNLLVGVLRFHSSNSSLWLLTKPCVFLCSTNTRLGRIFMWFPWILMTVTEAGTMGRLRKKGSLVLMAKNVPLSGPITPAPIYHPATAARDGPAADVPSLPPSLVAPARFSSLADWEKVFFLGCRLTARSHHREASHNLRSRGSWKGATQSFKLRFKQHFGKKFVEMSDVWYGGLRGSKVKGSRIL